MLKWAHRNGCPWNEDTCAMAAKHGHLAVLQYARENGCPWDENTITCAARSSHLEILQWARESSCPWSASTQVRAAEMSHLHWAYDNGRPFDMESFIDSSYDRNKKPRQLNGGNIPSLG
jgi:hypothetical protein